MPNDEVMRFIRNSKARHIFGVVDSCFSGSLFRNQKQPILSHRYQYKSRYLLTSGRFETVEDGIPGKQSPFSHCLLDHLKTNPEGLIWGGSLCRTVLDNFTYDSNLQHPCGEPLHGVGHRNGEFAFLKKGVDLSAIPQNMSEKDRPNSHEDEVYTTTEKPQPPPPLNIQSERIDQLNINTGKEINNNYYASRKGKDDKEEQPKQTSKLQSVDFHLLLVNIKELENDLPKKRFLVKLIEGAQQTYRKQPKEGLFELQNIFLQSITDLSRELKGSSISKEGKEHLLNILDSLFSILDSSPFEKSTIEELVNETQLVPIWYQIDLELSQKINNLLHIITSWCKSI